MTDTNFFLLLFVFAPFFLGFAFYVLHFKFLKALILLVPVLLIGLAVFLRISYVFPYEKLLLNEPMPYGMSLKMDDISFSLIVLNNTLFFITTLFGFHKPYFNKGFIFLFLSLEGLINGIFLSTDLFNLYVLIELSTVVVTMLIMTKEESRTIYDGLIYLMTNLVAMLFFLFGIGYCYKIFGVLDLASLKVAINQVDDPKTLILPFSFLMTGISLKAALLPLFSWLPRAHAAPSSPSIVSAILSGIFVKTGVYLLIRLHGLFCSQLELGPLFLFLGYSTAIFGFVFAIAQSDIKLVLAYHTISQMGLIVIGLGYNTDISTLGVSYHILSHGVFKSLLFLIAGVLIEHYHTRRISEMRNLWHDSKWLSILMLIAVLSITGAPFLSGAVSKSLIGETAPTLAMEIISMGTMLSFVKFIKILGKTKENTVNYVSVKVYKFQWAALIILVILCALLGTTYLRVSPAMLFRDFPQQFYVPFDKMMRYILLYFFCILFYAKVVASSRWIQKLKSVELTFNTMNLLMVTFFAGVMSYLFIST